MIPQHVFFMSILIVVVVVVIIVAVNGLDATDGRNGFDWNGQVTSGVARGRTAPGDTIQG